jgi:hypothetical protein
MSPEELSALADHYWSTRTKRLAADKVAAEFKTEEAKTEALLISEMRSAGLTAIGGQLVRLALPVEPDYAPAVTDWQKFYDYIVETNDFSLLERRVGRAAVKERWLADEQVPGVDRFPVWKLSKSEVKK